MTNMGYLLIFRAKTALLQNCPEMKKKLVLLLIIGIIFLGVTLCVDAAL